MQDGIYKYLIAAAIFWLIVPVIIVSVADWFGQDSTYNTPTNYTQIVTAFTTESTKSNTGILAKISYAIMDPLVTFMDWSMGWALEPVFNAGADFGNAINVLVNEFGLPSWFVWAFLTVYSLPVVVFIVWLIIEFLKMIGGFVPFT